MRMLGGNRRAIVAGKPNESTLTELQLVEALHQPAEGVVHLRDVAVMGAVGRIGRGIKLAVLRVGSDRLMRLVETDIQEEWLLGITKLLQPAECFAGDDMRRITFLLAHRLAVADKIAWVVVARNRVILRGKPVLKAVVLRLRLRRLVERPVEMPFANVAGRITGVFQ